MSRTSTLRFEKMNADWAREIATWLYDPPYQMYSFKPEDFEENLNHLLNPEYRYYCAFDKHIKLVGYSCFGEDAQVMGGDYQAEALDFGLGLRPELTGQGLGTYFLLSILDFAREQFSPAALRVTVATFNRRSLQVCEKAGFKEVQRFENPHSQDSFIVLMMETGF